MTKPKGQKAEGAEKPRPEFDYKDPEYLGRFLTHQAQIMPRKRTTFSTQRQRQLTLAVKRARHVALLPFVG